MAANKSVVILAPNGRRQIVRATANTTILQMLEDVCRKHGYNVDEYDVKHFNNILDVNAIFRFTGLPNNAQLEMVPCATSRKISNVTIGIQLENGERLTGEFHPNSTLAQVLENLCSHKDLHNAVLIYMHQEIHGKALTESTLKSLGLNNGRAMFRLIYRDPEQLKSQAHISMPLAPKPFKGTCSKDKDCRFISHTETKLDLSNVKIEKVEEQALHSVKSDQDVNVKEENLHFQQHMDEEGQDVLTKENQSVHLMDKSGVLKNLSSQDLCLNTADDSEIKFLGERNALIFNQSIVLSMPKDEIPDDFFDLTVNDAKTLLRDAKRLRQQLEDAPLLTDAQRHLNQNKRILDQLHKYRHTVIRIQFPDQFVLQGLFRPLETVQEIKNFVKMYINNPNSDFTIYTTPPKRTLDLTARLIDEGLVPSAIIHYSGSSELNPVIKAKAINPKFATLQAVKSRMLLTRENKDSETIDDINMEDDMENVSNPKPCSSKSIRQNEQKIPKWFRPSK